MTVAVALLVIFFIGSAVCAIAAGGIPAFAGTIRQKEVLFALRLSAATASLSTLIVMALALPTAYALTRTSMLCPCPTCFSGSAFLSCFHHRPANG